MLQLVWQVRAGTHRRLIGDMWPMCRSKVADCTDHMETKPKEESESNDALTHFEEFSNVHKSDRSFNTTQSNLAYIN